jgi:hypothetical protein
MPWQSFGMDTSRKSWMKLLKSFSPLSYYQKPAFMAGFFRFLGPGGFR